MFMWEGGIAFIRFSKEPVSQRGLITTELKHIVYVTLGNVMCKGETQQRPPKELGWQIYVDRDKNLIARLGTKSTPSTTEGAFKLSYPRQLGREA